MRTQIINKIQNIYTNGVMIPYNNTYMVYYKNDGFEYNHVLISSVRI